MNWKVIRNAINNKSAFCDESKFILGLDIGNSTSVLAYWDINRNEPALIDISGGYGKPQTPTVIQFISETSEWIYGDYAILNKGYFNDITIANFVDRLGTNEYIDINGKSISLAQLTSKYIKELFDMCRNINPNAEIAGIVISTPPYMPDAAKEELRRACLIAGFDKEFICFIDERECILRYKEHMEKSVCDEKVLVIDYGDRSVRGSILDVSYNYDGVVIDVLSSVVNNNISGNIINGKTEQLIYDYFYSEKKIKPKQLSNEDKAQLDSFIYQNKYLLLQTDNKNIKLYYNFAFPPFQKTVTHETRNDLLHPIKQEFSEFIDSLFSRALGDSISFKDISTVICCGGGFDMSWIKKELEKKLPNAKYLSSKQPKGIAAQGACIAATAYIGIIKNQNYVINDKHKLLDDYGIMVRVNNKQKFIPVIERNSFWWEKNKKQKFILNENIENSENSVILELFKRNEQGFESKITEFKINGLPVRPKGTTKLSLLLEFDKFNKLTTTVTDCGFGELYPSCGLERTFTTSI